MFLSELEGFKRLRAAFAPLLYPPVVLKSRVKPYIRKIRTGLENTDFTSWSTFVS